MGRCLRLNQFLILHFQGPHSRESIKNLRSESNVMYTTLMTTVQIMKLPKDLGNAKVERGRLNRLDVIARGDMNCKTFS